MPTDAFLVQVEEATFGFMSQEELERRYQITVDWKGRPCLNLKDAAEVFRICNERADKDSRIRNAWLVAQGEWQHRRSQVRLAASQALQVPEGIGDAQATALRTAAGNAALSAWDRQHPMPGSDMPGAPANEFEWYERTHGRI